MKNNQSKKILIATNHAYMLWQFRRELITELQKENYLVLLLPFDDQHYENLFIKMGIKCIDTPIERRGINPFSDFELINRYRKILQEEQPDLVITYSIKPNIYVGLLCGLLNIRYFANVQGLGTAFERPKLALLVTFLYRVAFRRVSAVFFENENNAIEFKNRNIISAEKEKVMNGAGINLNRYPFNAYPQNDKTHFLYLGRIMKEKGMDELFAAISNLYLNRKDFVLDIVGFYEDDYRDTINKLVKKGIVVYHGFQENTLPYYVQADCVVLPSYHEGMSNVLLEGSAVGRPLITTNIPGCREAVDDGINGILVKPKDMNSLRDAMEEFLNKSITERINMGKAGRQKMENEFEKMKVVNKTIQILFSG